MIVNLNELLLLNIFTSLIVEYGKTSMSIFRNEPLSYAIFSSLLLCSPKTSRWSKPGFHDRRQAPV